MHFSNIFMSIGKDEFCRQREKNLQNPLTISPRLCMIEKYSKSS